MAAIDSVVPPRLLVGYQQWERDIQLGMQNLLVHGLRSLLTMLGMIFGVAAVVAMLSIGAGARRSHQMKTAAKTAETQNSTTGTVAPKLDVSASMIPNISVASVPAPSRVPAASADARSDASLHFNQIQATAAATTSATAPCRA